MLGDGGTADISVNGSYILGPVTESNSILGFTPSFKDNTPGNLSSFGDFSLSLNTHGGFTDAATSISFTLTDLGTPWRTAAGVLTPNDDASWPESGLGLRRAWLQHRQPGGSFRILR